MDCYEVWVDLAPGTDDLAFAEAARAFMQRLVDKGEMARFRIRRRKFGFGPEGLGEWSITMEFESLTQMDGAFDRVATRTGVIEDLHTAVYSRVRNFRSGLYRDFPDPVRGKPSD